MATLALVGDLRANCGLVRYNEDSELPPAVERVHAAVLDTTLRYCFSARASSIGQRENAERVKFNFAAGRSCEATTTV